MNIIYLDFDGVVITAKQRNQSTDRDFLCPDKIAMVKSLCDRTGAKVVVSSTWRVSDNCRNAIAKAGLPADYLYPDWATPLHIDTPDDISSRGYEIAVHVDANDVRNYVILDDITVLDSQACRHIKIDPDIGLLPHQIDQAFAILSNPRNDIDA